jgi:hypothetical protein
MVCNLNGNNTAVKEIFLAEIQTTRALAEGKYF